MAYTVGPCMSTLVARATASSPATIWSINVGSGIGVIEIEFEQMSTAAAASPACRAGRTTSSTSMAPK